jgi:branched-chain amino acid transport system permease protein
MPPEIIVNGLVNSSIVVLMALGLVMVFSIMGILNFAHGQFYMMGAYILYCIFGMLGINYFVSLILATLALALVGVLMEKFIMRPIGQPLPVIVATIAMIQVYEGIVVLIFGPNPNTVPAAIEGTTMIAGATISNEKIFIVITAVALVIGLYIFLHRTKWGLAIRASAQLPVTAGLFGIQSARVTSLVMALGCGLAAMAGGIMAPVFYVDPWIGMGPLTWAMLAIIIGGLGSLMGAVVGGALIGLLNTVLAYYIGHWATLIGLIILVLLLLFRPQGLFGVSEK